MDVSLPQPTYLGCGDNDGYTHDAQCVTYHGPDADFVGHEICFAFNEDTVTIMDVTDANNVRLLSKTGYPNSQYTHQGWVDEQHEYLYFDDELDEMRGRVSKTTTYIMDVRDLNSPALLDTYTATTNAIDHNLYIKNGHVYQ